VQGVGKKEVNGANVLIAIFGEKDSHAVYFLHKQNISRFDVVNYISHGISKVPGETQPELPPPEEGDEVEFEIQAGPKGPQAARIRALP